MNFTGGGCRFSTHLVTAILTTPLESFPLAVSPFAFLLLLLSVYKTGAFSKDTIMDVVLFTWMLVSSCVVFYAVMATFGLGMVAMFILFFGLSVFGASVVRDMRKRWNNPEAVVRTHITKKEKRKNMKKLMKERELTAR